MVHNGYWRGVSEGNSRMIPSFFPLDCVSSTCNASHFGTESQHILRMPFNIDLDLSPIGSFGNIDKGKFEDIDIGVRLVGSMYLPNLCFKSWLTFAMREGEGGRWGRPTVEPLIVPSLPKGPFTAGTLLPEPNITIANDKQSCKKRKL